MPFYKILGIFDYFIKNIGTLNFIFIKGVCIYQLNFKNNNNLFKKYDIIYLGDKMKKEIDELELLKQQNELLKQQMELAKMKSSNNNNNLPLIIVIVMLFLIVIVLGFFLINNSNNENSDTENSNTNNNYNNEQEKQCVRWEYTYNFDWCKYTYSNGCETTGQTCVEWE